MWTIQSCLAGLVRKAFPEAWLLGESFLHVKEWVASKWFDDHNVAEIRLSGDGDPEVVRVN